MSDYSRYYILTPMEVNIWKLLAQGYSRPGMAKILNISVTTVATHLLALYRKLGIQYCGKDYNPALLAVKLYYENKEHEVK